MGRIISVRSAFHFLGVRVRVCVLAAILLFLRLCRLVCFGGGCVWSGVKFLRIRAVEGDVPFFFFFFLFWFFFGMGTW